MSFLGDSRRDQDGMPAFRLLLQKHLAATAYANLYPLERRGTSAPITQFQKWQIISKYNRH